MKDGFSAVAQGVVPSFTNPNNMSIVTGAPPSVHGVPGNYFLDPATGQGVMMNTPRFLRSETVLGAFSRAGARVAAITAKDKLRTLLGHGVDVTNGSVVFSAEKADLCTLDECGIEDVLGLVGQPLPDIYSAELSMFAVGAAVRIVEERRPDLTYLSLTDYVQHTNPPGSPEMNSFMRRLDDGLGRLAALGVTVAVTADHGMSDKAKTGRVAERRLPAGRPRLYVRRRRSGGRAAHHRPLRCPPRLPGRLRLGLLRRRPGTGRHRVGVGAAGG